eukprot:scaffold5693_cov141-Skeletonema_menzelii.AAC.26
MDSIAIEYCMGDEKRVKIHACGGSLKASYPSNTKVHAADIGTYHFRFVASLRVQANPPLSLDPPPKSSRRRPSLSSYLVAG